MPGRARSPCARHRLRRPARWGLTSSSIEPSPRGADKASHDGQGQASLTLGLGAITSA